MTRKRSEWLDKYELIDRDKIPKVSPPVAESWAKALYDMPADKAGRIVTSDCETADRVRSNILGSIRSARRAKRNLDFKVATTIVLEDGKYVLYFFPQRGD